MADAGIERSTKEDAKSEGNVMPWKSSHAAKTGSPPNLSRPRFLELADALFPVIRQHNLLRNGEAEITVMRKGIGVGAQRIA